MSAVDANSVGQDRTYKDATEAYDAAHGKHVDSPPEDLPDDTKYPQGNMPKAPDPSPFQLGPMTPGTR